MNEFSSPSATSATSAKVPSVDRAVRLLDRLAATRHPATLTELVNALQLPKSSVHGLLGTLTALDLIRRTPDNTFQLGPRVLQWADAYSLQSDLVTAFNELSGTHTQLAENTLMLAVLDGSDVLYLACQPGNRALAVNFRVGGRFPATCTSSGKAILSTLESEDVGAHLTSPMTRLTKKSVSSRSKLQRQLVEVRTQGFAIDDEETADGMMCFGAPIYGSGQSQAVAAVAVSLIKATVNKRRKLATVSAIRDLAQRISERIGGRHT